MMTLWLRCIVLHGNVSRNSLFTIEIPADRDVDELKAAISKRNHYTFPPYELSLWQVSIPMDTEFEARKQTWPQWILDAFRRIVWYIPNPTKEGPPCSCTTASKYATDLSFLWSHLMIIFLFSSPFASWAWFAYLWHGFLSPFSPTQTATTIIHLPLIAPVEYETAFNPSKPYRMQRRLLLRFVSVEMPL